MTARSSVLRTVLRRVVLGAFVCTVAVIVVLLGEVVLSITGLSFDPHGYTVVFGVFLAGILAPVALMLWLLYRLLRR